MENDSMEKLADFLTGEKALRDKEQSIENAKKEAIKEEKNKRRRDIVEGKAKLKEDPVQKKKVVQNIKLFEWSAPERYQIKLQSKNFLIIVVISLLFISLLAVLGKYYLIFAIISVLFVIYAAGSTKPLIAKHKITARGIETVGKLYEWYMLEDFYFCKKGNMYTLLVQTKLNFPKALVLLCNEKDKDPIFVILQEKLLYRDIRKKLNKVDVLSFGEYVPLEKI